MSTGMHDAGAMPATGILNAAVGRAAVNLEVGKRTGLGRSLSYGMVQTLQGRIEVQGEMGNGAAFKIWLPIGGHGEAA